jgi:hypothetical protein
MDRYGATAAAQQRQPAWRHRGRTAAASGGQVFTHVLRKNISCVYHGVLLLRHRLDAKNFAKIFRFLVPSNL